MNIFRKFFKYYLPMLCFRIGKADKIWDKVLNNLLNKYTPIVSDNKCTCKLGDIKVWIGNYPYSFGQDYDVSGGGFPKRLTAIRLKIIIDDIIKEQEQKEKAKTIWKNIYKDI